MACGSAGAAYGQIMSVSMTGCSACDSGCKSVDGCAGWVWNNNNTCTRYSEYYTRPGASSSTCKTGAAPPPAPKATKRVWDYTYFFSGGQDIAYTIDQVGLDDQKFADTANAPDNAPSQPFQTPSGADPSCGDSDLTTMQKVWGANRFKYIGKENKKDTNNNQIGSYNYPSNDGRCPTQGTGQICLAGTSEDPELSGKVAVVNHNNYGTPLITPALSDASTKEPLWNRVVNKWSIEPAKPTKPSYLTTGADGGTWVTGDDDPPPIGTSYLWGSTVNARAKSAYGGIAIILGILTSARDSIQSAYLKKYLTTIDDYTPISKETGADTSKSGQPLYAIKSQALVDAGLQDILDSAPVKVGQDEPLVIGWGHGMGYMRAGSVCIMQRTPAYDPDTKTIGTVPNNFIGNGRLAIHFSIGIRSWSGEWSVGDGSSYTRANDYISGIADDKSISDAAAAELLAPQPQFMEMTYRDIWLLLNTIVGLHGTKNPPTSEELQGNIYTGKGIIAENMTLGELQQYVKALPPPLPPRPKYIVGSWYYTYGFRCPYILNGRGPIGGTGCNPTLEDQRNGSLGTITCSTSVTSLTWQGGCPKVPATPPPSTAYQPSCAVDQYGSDGDGVGYINRYGPAPKSKVAELNLTTNMTKWNYSKFGSIAREEDSGYTTLPQSDINNLYPFEKPGTQTGAQKAGNIQSEMFNCLPSQGVQGKDYPNTLKDSKGKEYNTPTYTYLSLYNEGLNKAKYATVVMNASLYLGTGSFEDRTACLNRRGTSELYDFIGTGTWQQIRRDSDLPDIEPGVPSQKIINFGGWGCCPRPTVSGSNDPNRIGRYCANTKNCPGEPYTDPAGAPSASTPGNAPGCKGPCNKYSFCNNCAKVQISATESQYQSTGPNCVWSWEHLMNLPRAIDIVSAGYTGVSIDIEGVWVSIRKGTCSNPADSSDCEGVDAYKLFVMFMGQKLQEYHSAGLVTILTLPGFGVSTYGKTNYVEAAKVDTSTSCKNIQPSFDEKSGWIGAMEWYPEVLSKYGDYLDFVCLMYYAKIGDTLTQFQPNSKDAPWMTSLKSSLEMQWSEEGGASVETGSQPKLPANKIILGVSLKADDSSDKILNEVFSSDVLKLARGGFTDWAYTGGTIDYAKTWEWQTWNTTEGQEGVLEPVTVDTNSLTTAEVKAIRERRGMCMLSAGGGGGGQCLQPSYDAGGNRTCEDATPVDPNLCKANVAKGAPPCCCCGAGNKVVGGKCVNDPGGPCPENAYQQAKTNSCGPQRLSDNCCCKTGTTPNQKNQTCDPKRSNYHQGRVTGAVTGLRLLDS